MLIYVGMFFLVSAVATLVLILSGVWPNNGLGWLLLFFFSAPLVIFFEGLGEAWQALLNKIPGRQKLMESKSSSLAGWRVLVGVVEIGIIFAALFALGVWFRDLSNGTSP